MPSKPFLIISHFSGFHPAGAKISVTAPGYGSAVLEGLAIADRTDKPAGLGLQHRILASVARRQHVKPVQKCGGAKSANCCVWARASYTLVDTCSARAPA